MHEDKRPHQTDAKFLCSRVQLDDPGTDVFHLRQPFGGKQPLYRFPAESEIEGTVIGIDMNAPVFHGAFRQKITGVQGNGFLRKGDFVLPVLGRQRQGSDSLKFLAVEHRIPPGRPAVHARVVADQLLCVRQAEIFQRGTGSADIILQRAKRIVSAGIRPEQIDQLLGRDTPIPMKNQIDNQSP